MQRYGQADYHRAGAGSGVPAGVGHDVVHVVDDESPGRKFKVRENPAAGRVQQYAPPTEPR
jgi:hypothetical protein